MSIDFSASLKGFNPENQELILTVNFITPEILGNLEQLYEDNDLIRVSLKGKVRKTKQYFQQKAWYGSLALILKRLKVELSKETLGILDDDLRGSIFPVKYTEYGQDNNVPYVPRMRDLSFEEMRDCIIKLHERYEYLEIDFSSLASR